MLSLSDANKLATSDEIIELRAINAALLEACKAARKCMAHKSTCARPNPSEEWKEKGSWNFDNCSCEIKLMDAVIAKAEGKS